MRRSLSQGMTGSPSIRFFFFFFGVLFIISWLVDPFRSASYDASARSRSGWYARFGFEVRSGGGRSNHVFGCCEGCTVKKLRGADESTYRALFCSPFNISGVTNSYRQQLAERLIPVIGGWRGLVVGLFCRSQQLTDRWWEARGYGIQSRRSSHRPPPAVGYDFTVASTRDVLAHSPGGRYPGEGNRGLEKNLTCFGGVLV